MTDLITNSSAELGYPETSDFTWSETSCPNCGYGRFDGKLCPYCQYNPIDNPIVTPMERWDLKPVTNDWSPQAREAAAIARKATAAAKDKTASLPGQGETKYHEGAYHPTEAAKAHEHSGLAISRAKLGMFSWAARHHTTAAFAHQAAFRETGDQRHWQAAAHHIVAAKKNLKASKLTETLAAAQRSELAANVWSEQAREASAQARKARKVWSSSDTHPEHSDWNKLEAHPDYFYHATNLENAHEIASGHLIPHRPWHGTQQHEWPDSSKAHRSYFTDKPSTAYHFAPEHGKPVLLRVKRNKQFKTESTGDTYLQSKKIPAHRLEILTHEGWKRLAHNPTANTLTYNEHQKTVAVDLDGTLADTLQHDIDRDREEPPSLSLCPVNEEVLDELVAAANKGWRIIIWTVRDEYPEIEQWLSHHAVPYDFINYNPDQPTTSPKIIADKYMDDRNIMPGDPIANWSTTAIKKAVSGLTDDQRDGLVVWLNHEAGKCVIDSMDWHEGGGRKIVGKVAEEELGKDGVEYQNEGPRPKGSGWVNITANAFCRTGKGGKVDPHCSPGKKTTKATPTKTTTKQQPSPEHLASKEEHAESRQLAMEKIRNAPVPSKKDVKKACKEIKKARKGLGRAGGESRGGSAASRRKQRQNLFKEWGGEEKGYVVCPWTGLRMHWTNDASANPNGYPTFERGKIFTKIQGGGYQLPNLIPESFTANRSRNDTKVRSENDVEC